MWLCLDGRQVVLGPALEDVSGAERSQARDLHHVLPDVLRQHHGEPRQELFLGVALLLEVDAIGVEEDGAPVAELRAERGLEGGVGILAHGDAELVRHRLQEHPVPGRALVGEPEVPDLAFDEEEDLDVLPTDVADHIDVAAVLHRRHLVRDGLDNVDVGADRFLEDVSGVAGRAESEDLESRALVVDEGSELGEELLRIGDRVAFRQHVLLREELAPLIHQHGLGGGRSAVHPDHRPDSLARREGRRDESRDRVLAAESLELLLASNERRSSLRAEARLAAARDEFLERSETAVEPRTSGLVESVERGAVRSVVLRVFRNEDELLERNVARRLEAACGPCLRDPLAPAGLEERQIGVRTAEQEHAWLERVPPREHREILGDDRVGERAEDLGGGNARFDEVDDVGLGEDPALRGNVVELRRVPRDSRGLLLRESDLDHALVDRRAGAGSALVVHGGDRALVAGLLVLLVEDDLRVLPTELDDGTHIGVEVVDRHRDGVHFLHELRPERLAERPGARAGEERARAAPANALPGLRTFSAVAPVSLVIRPEDRFRGGIDDGFDGGGTTSMPATSAVLSEQSHRLGPFRRRGELTLSGPGRRSRGVAAGRAG
jgi:hypothetical protein